MSTINLLRFNNYYNRIIKKFDNISQYNDYIIATYPGINFNPNDGISTIQIINYDGEIMPDYIIETDEFNQIKSRWYIIESKRTRSLQFQLNLYRDVISDWYDEIIQANIFIEKATLSSQDPLLFNSENMSYNQILQSQTLIQDKTKCAWVVGYLPRNFPSTSTTITTNVNSPTIQPDIVATSLSNWVKFAFGADVSYDPDTLLTDDLRVHPGSYSTYSITWSGGNEEIKIYESFISAKTGYLTRTDSLREGEASLKCTIPFIEQQVNLNQLIDPFVTKFSIFDPYLKNIGNKVTSLINCLSLAQTEALDSYDNKIIKDGSTGLFYRISIERSSIARPRETFAVPNASNTFIAMNAACNYEAPFSNTADGSTFKVYYMEPVTNIKFNQVTELVQVDLDSIRYHCYDSPYDVFCIPYGELKILKSGQVDIEATNKECAFQIATAISEQTGLNSSQYDIQLLPFCPALYTFADKNLADGVIEIGDASVDYIFNTVGDKISVILWAQSSNFQFTVPYSIPNPSSPIEQKVMNECDFWRICSPNYNGVFEFNAAKNYGVEYISIACTYKPYNPFIHIKPKFSGLYGLNPDKDNRGLICGGDFSLPQISNAWAQYELNNKNYQAIFDRQIQSLDLRNDIQRIRDVANVITGTVSGTVSGAMSGAMVGGGMGAAIGGVVGGVTSGLGGALDLILNEELRKEALDLAKDQFGYQLGNIRAIPNSISKTSAIVYNNKIFPFIEYYTCTDREKEALRNKLKYNGMTVMTIGSIKDYLSENRSYIKGKLIRTEDIDEDYHVIKTIADELNKGVYI